MEKLGATVSTIQVDINAWQPVLDIYNESGKSYIEFKADLAKHLADFKQYVSVFLASEKLMLPA